MCLKAHWLFFFHVDIGIMLITVFCVFKLILIDNVEVNYCFLKTKIIIEI
eukprot:UN03854